MVEMVQAGRPHYVLAAYPPAELREVKWCSVRRVHPIATTPAELLAAIPEATPVSEDLLYKVSGMRGCWTFNKEALDLIPRLEWGGLLPARAAGRPEAPRSSGSATSSTSEWCPTRD